MVLQWPALILWHFHVQSYERNSLDFLCFTMARGHFAAFSCQTGCALTIGFSWFYNGPRAFCGTSMFNLMRAICWISLVLQWPAGNSLHFHGPRALRVRVRGASARGTVCTRCTRASTHVQWTISMRVRGRAVIFMAFNAFAEMLNKYVFIAHSGVCHELNSLIWACGM